MKPNKLLKSTVVYDTNGKSHTSNMYADLCECCGYYFTIDGIKLDWSFPSVCFGLALTHYEIICYSETDVDYIIKWALGNN